MLFRSRTFENFPLKFGIAPKRVDKFGNLFLDKSEKRVLTGTTYTTLQSGHNISFALRTPIEEFQFRMNSAKDQEKPLRVSFQLFFIERIE